MVKIKQVKGKQKKKPSRIKKGWKDMREAFKPGKAEARLKQFGDLLNDPTVKIVARIAEKKHKKRRK